MRKASIIIAVDSEFPLINNFFELLFTTHKCDNYEIIVIDDHCLDIQTVTLLQKLHLEGKVNKLLRLPQKAGFGRANNVGVSLSTTEYLVLLNTDIILRGKEIDMLLDRLIELKCDAIQPLLLYPQNGKIQSSGHIFGHLFNRHALENNLPDILNGKRAIDRQAITPAFCIIRKQAFLTAGQFDEFYYNSFEALDLTLSIHLNGGRCVVAPDIWAYHIRMASRSNVEYNEEQQNPYFWKKYGLLTANDYISLVNSQITDNMKAENYIVCSFSHLDLATELSEIGLKFAEVINLQQSGKIELFGILPYSFLHTPYPLLLLCNNINLIIGNALWISLRSNAKDLVIDSAGNVVYLQKV